MNQAAILQLIIALLPVAEKLVFSVGGKLIEIATTDLNSTDAVSKALDAAKAEGFPQLSFVPGLVPAGTDMADTKAV